MESRSDAASKVQLAARGCVKGLSSWRLYACCSPIPRRVSVIGGPTEVLTFGTVCRFGQTPKWRSVVPAWPFRMRVVLVAIEFLLRKCLASGSVTEGGIRRQG